MTQAFMHADTGNAKPVCQLAKQVYETLCNVNTSVITSSRKPSVVSGLKITRLKLTSLSIQIRSI